MLKEYPVYVDIKNEKYTLTKVKELDNVKLTVYITDNGLVKNITGNTFVLNVRKYDKTLVVQNTNITIQDGAKGILSIVLNIDALRVPGEAAAELEITDTNGTISTATFHIYVDSKVTHSTSPSSNTSTITELLQLAIAQGQLTKTELQEVIDTADLTTYASRGDVEEINASLAESTQLITDLNNNKADKTAVNLKADTTYVDTKVAAVASGNPIPFATLSALQADSTANTVDGKKRTYVVATDGKWYYWNGSAWTVGGTYQSTGIGNNNVQNINLSSSLQTSILNSNNYKVSILTNDGGLGNNGATINTTTNTITVPNGSSGTTSYLKFKNTNYSFNKDCEVKLYFKLSITDVAGFNFNKYFKVKRNNVITTLTLKSSISIVQLSDTEYLIGGVFDVLRNDTELYCSFEIIRSTAVTQDITIQILDSFILIDSIAKASDMIESLTNEVQLFNGAEAPKEVLLDVSGDIFLNITQNFNTSLRVYGVKNGVDYLLPTTNLNTGFTDKQIVYCSRYKVHCKGYTQIKLKNTCSDIGNSKLIVYYYKSDNSTPIKSIGDYHNRVNGSKISNVIRTVTGISVFAIRDGKLLGAKIVGGQIVIVESDINYTNFTDKAILADETEMILHMIVNADNSVIMACKTGKILRTVDFVTFTEVLNLGSSQFRFGAFSQWDTYANMVLISEYKQPATYQNTERTSRNLYLSTDYGVTFTVIFNLVDYISNAGGFHIHSVKYDPYEAIIWLCAGDGFGNQMIFYSKDFGGTWYKSTEFTESPTQVTQIIPLRNCVLFLTDCRLTSVFRYNRATCGTLAGVPMYFDMAYLIQEEWGKTSSTEVPIGSVPAIDYSNSKAYFGFLTVTTTHNENTTDNLKYGDIFATDGYTFSKVFVDSVQVADGVVSVYRDSSKNKVIGKLGLQDKFVEINSDIWEKC